VNHKDKVTEENKRKKDESWLDIELTEKEIMDDLNYGRSSFEEPKTSFLN
jgi:hypothetical protein